MIIVTGAAGFIGSCVVAELNRRGYEDLILVDQLEPTTYDDEASIGLKKLNLKDKKYKIFLDKQDFLYMILKKDAFVNVAGQNDSLAASSHAQEFAFDLTGKNIEAVIHMGACSSTTLQDAQYFRGNNLEYSQYLAQWALQHQIPFIYASSAATYGDGSHGYKDDIETMNGCKPLNLYGQSKQDFDAWILQNGLLDRVVGLKFFNVFGPNEYHKKDMRSIVAKAYDGIVRDGKMRLFKSYRSEYADGEQRRDFVYVKDAVDVVMFFLDHPKIGGIFNVGTGESRTWNELARALFQAVGKTTNIEYFDMPDSLKKQYQYYTQADMRHLRDVGYTKPFTKLEDAVKDYVGYLKNQSHL